MGYYYSCSFPTFSCSCSSIHCKYYSDEQKKIAVDKEDNENTIITYFVNAVKDFNRQQRAVETYDTVKVLDAFAGDITDEKVYVKSGKRCYINVFIKNGNYSKWILQPILKTN
ncbi:MULTISPECIES: hypothetical protein [Bacillaceae]|uniref:hypothetical protein n=1 Tax=Bacillaceae TaxID=186817 RepID=UPI001596F2DB|nr:MULTISPECIES: hypothetical protein [unclassified Bacillus (in: firmicutes)]